MLDLLNLLPRALFLPPASLFLVVLLGLALWLRWPRAGRWVAGTGFAALFFLSTVGGATFLVRLAERDATPLAKPDGSGAQAIVVLAAGRLQAAPEYGGRDIPDTIALARLRYAAHLQRRSGLPILVSGGSGTSGPDAAKEAPVYSFADAMATALREDFGVPVRWIESKSRDTGENAAFSAAILRRDGVRRVLLVTDAMHMPRSRRVFERAGLEVVEAPTMFFGRQPLGPRSWLPSAEGMRRSWYAVYELIGSAWYRLRFA